MFIQEMLIEHLFGAGPGKNLVYSVNRADLVSDSVKFPGMWVRHRSTNNHTSGLSAPFFNRIHACGGVCILPNLCLRYFNNP